MLVLQAVVTLQALTLATAPQAPVAPGEIMGLGAALLDGDFSPPNLLLRSRDVARTKPRALTNATVALALATMNFHRRMMNEYLCRGYMAEDILERLRLDAESSEPAWRPHGSTLQHRTGQTKSKRRKDEDSTRSKMMLGDEGSMNYRNWLERSAVLDDIYLHFENDGTEEGTESALKMQSRGDDDDEVEEEVSEPPTKSKGSTSSSSKGVRIKTKGKKTKGSISYEDSISSATHSHREPEYIDFPPDDISEGGGGGHGGSAVGFNMKDFYDITLTAVAFLAFGIFIFNVFMGIFMTKPSTQTVVVANTSLPVARLGYRNLEDDPTHERIARWVQEPPLFARVETGEEIVARFALMSLNAAIQPLRPSCLQAALCKGNKRSRDIEGQAKYWLPVWSLGMSWLAPRGGGDAEPGSAALFSGALENLRASTLGLAGARCQELFPQC